MAFYATNSAIPSSTVASQLWSPAEAPTSVKEQATAAFLNGRATVSALKELNVQDLPAGGERESTRHLLLRAGSLLKQALGATGCGFIKASDESTRIQETVYVTADDECDSEGHAHFEAKSSSNQTSAVTTQPRLTAGQLTARLCLESPWGKLWNTASGGPAVTELPEMDGQRRDVRELQDLITDATTFMIGPLVDARTSKSTTSCLVWSIDPKKLWSLEDVTFLRAFLNNVAVEIARLTAIETETRKIDFISSISHELRSPLHGILAAAEFLNDTNLDSSQRQLLSTQLSCGKTLLDVIDHVLAYSKVNAIGRNDWPQDVSSLEGTVSNARASGTDTDIAQLIEEVVAGAVAGVSFKIHDTSGALRDGENDLIAPPAGYSDVSHLEIALEIDYLEDWTYKTMPGPFRRMVMNILGNALKYTHKGSVRVILQSQPASTLATDDFIVALSIIDTGPGISSAYLRDNVFQPFSQENRLNSGCGLGLSTARSIVELLHGSIDIRSRLGHGTKVEIRMPMESARPRTPAVQLMEKSDNPNVPKGKTLYLDGFDDEEQSAKSALPIANQRGALSKASILKYAQEWLMMDVITSSWQDADVTIVADWHIEAYIRLRQQNASSAADTPIIAILHNGFQESIKRKLDNYGVYYEFIAVPVGPRNLTNAIQNCLQSRSTRPRFSDKDGLTISESSIADPEPKETNVTPLAGASKPKVKMTGAETASKHDRDDAPPKLPFLIDRAGAPLNFPYRPLALDALMSESATPTSDGQIQPAIDVMSNPKQPAQAFRQPRALLVDDNEINLRLLETYMRKRKYDYVGAKDGLMALKEVQRRTADTSVDVIFMDLSMPIMDGIESTTEIRAYEKSEKDSKRRGALPAFIIALTGRGAKEDQEEAFAAGVNLFMTKPVKFQDLGLVLDKWIEKEGEQRGIAR